MRVSRSVRWVESRLSAEAPQRRTTDVWLEHRGWSMAPTLRPGDRLCIEAVSGEEARSGEVVIARRGGRLTAHRLTARRGGSVITRGDGNSFEDPPLPASQVVGRVVEVVRDGRRSRPAPRPGLVARAVRWLVRATT